MPYNRNIPSMIDNVGKVLSHPAAQSVATFGPALVAMSPLLAAGHSAAPHDPREQPRVETRYQPVGMMHDGKVPPLMTYNADQQEQKEDEQGPMPGVVSKVAFIGPALAAGRAAMPWLDRAGTALMLGQGAMMAKNLMAPKKQPVPGQQQRMAPAAPAPGAGPTEGMTHLASVRRVLKIAMLDTALPMPQMMQPLSPPPQSMMPAMPAEKSIRGPRAAGASTAFKPAEAGMQQQPSGVLTKIKNNANDFVAGAKDHLATGLTDFLSPTHEFDPATFHAVDPSSPLR